VNQTVLDELPNDSSHFVAVELDNDTVNLDFFHEGPFVTRVPLILLPPEAWDLRYRNGTNSLPVWYHWPMASTLRLPEAIDARLTELSAKSGKSRNQIIIDILGDQFEREDAMLEAERIFDRIATRDAGLLTRLADA
jgi:predicted transcriptional regulator